MKVVRVWECEGCESVRVWGLWECEGCEGCESVRVVRVVGELSPHSTILHNNLHRKETSASQWHLTVHKAPWYMLNFSGSLILQISQSFSHLQKYFNENFWLVTQFSRLATTRASMRGQYPWANYKLANLQGTRSLKRYLQSRHCFVQARADECDDAR